MLDANQVKTFCDVVAQLIVPLNQVARLTPPTPPPMPTSPEPAQARHD